MTRRWRCNNTVLFVRESRVSASEIFGVFLYSSADRILQIYCTSTARTL